MCDYSLMAVPNRLARHGEELVTHRFRTGSMGLASPADLKRTAEPSRPANKSFWRAVMDFFNPPAVKPVVAVCIPPGTPLRLDGITAHLQRQLGVGAAEHVTFTQLSAAANAYRDALRFSNGGVVLLQDLKEGQRVWVLDLPTAEDFDLEPLQGERAELEYRNW